MAITILKKPLATVPVYNQIMYHASSNQIAQPNFRYYITVSVTVGGVTTGLTPIVLSPKIGAGDMYLSLSNVLSNYLKSYYPFGLYGWQSCNGSIAEVVVNIGERYGTTPTIYTGTNHAFYTWNGSMKEDERASMTQNSYFFDDPTLGGRALNNYSSKIKIRSSHDLVMYYLLSGIGSLNDVKITTYNSSGSVVGTSFIAVPAGLLTASVNNRMICINVGVNGLTAIPSGLVTGAYPIITPAVTSYELKFEEGLDIAEGAGVINKYNVTINDSCCVETSTLFYLNRFGAFDHINMCGHSKVDLEISKTYFRQIEPYMTGSYIAGTSTYTTPVNPLPQNKLTQTNNYTKTTTYLTEKLNDHDVDMLADCFTSPNLFIQKANTNYEYLNQNDTVFNYRKSVIDKVIQMQLRVSNSKISYRQTGE